MNLFVISNNLFDDREYAIAEPKNDRYGDFPKCSACGGPIGSRRWLPEFMVKLSKKKVGDFVFGSVDPFLVTEKIVNIVYDNEIHGVTSFNQVTVTNNKNVKLYIPEIEYGALKIDEEVSGFIRTKQQRCEVCRLGGAISAYNKLEPAINTWDGLDIFVLRQLPGTIVLSEKFYNLCNENMVTNLTVKQMQDYYPPWMKQ